MAEDENIFFFPDSPATGEDPACEAVLTILEWVERMKQEGRCPAEVQEALAILFREWLAYT